MIRHFKQTEYRPHVFPRIAKMVREHDAIGIFEQGTVSLYGHKAYKIGNFAPDAALTRSVAQLLGLDYDTEAETLIFLGNTEELAEALRHVVCDDLIIDTEPLGSCAVCGKPFTIEDYNERHSDPDNMDLFYHPECCPICNAKEE